jgi:translation initiation factor IF-2
MHEESMKSLVGNVYHSDVVLVSAEKEELHAYKGILAAHSRVTYSIKYLEFPP